MCELRSEMEDGYPRWVCCTCQTLNGAHRMSCRSCTGEYCGPRYEVVETELMMEHGHCYRLVTKVREVK